MTCRCKESRRNAEQCLASPLSRAVCVPWLVTCRRKQQYMQQSWEVWKSEQNNLKSCCGINTRLQRCSVFFSRILKCWSKDEGRSEVYRWNWMLHFNEVKHFHGLAFIFNKSQGFASNPYTYCSSKPVVSLQGGHFVLKRKLNEMPEWSYAIMIHPVNSIIKEQHD